MYPGNKSTITIKNESHFDRDRMTAITDVTLATSCGLPGGLATNFEIINQKMFQNV